MRLKIFTLAVLFLFAFIPTNTLVSAQSRVLPPEPPEERYYRAKVTKIIKEETKDVGGFTNFVQTIELSLTSGPEKGKRITVQQGGAAPITNAQKLSSGQEVVIIQSTIQGKTQYTILDRYRLGNTLAILLGFFFLVVLIAGKKGLGSILGMIFSIFVILQFIVPQILLGRDPLFISIAGSLAIMTTTLYLAHGISRKTTIALSATAISLLLAGISAYIFVTATKLTGLGSEEAGFLLQVGRATINMQGLLLGGIIIGALGVLDDITTSQTAAVFEIARANKTLSFLELVVRGYRIGKEHIASLVNTLVLAYAGASLSLFILFVINPSNQPYWVILNSQMIIEEIIRTVAGSIALVLAVPIATVLASWAAIKWPQK